MVVEICRILGQDNSESFKDERLKRGETTENVGLIIGYINEMKERDGRPSKEG